MAAIIAEWKKKGKEWRWGFKRSGIPFVIPSGREREVLKTKDFSEIMEGVSYPSSVLFQFPVAPTTPDVGIRFKTDAYDSEWFFSAYNLFLGGATQPNNSLYCSTYDPVNNIYSVASDGHRPFEEELIFSLFNQSDQPVTVLAYAMLYAHVLKFPEIRPRKVE